MKDQTELAPCPFCENPAFESAGLFGCDNRFCIMRHAPLIEKHEWQNRPDLRRIKELEAINEKYRALAEAAGNAGQENERDRIITEHRQRIKELEAALLAIGEFGVKNTGRGFTCAKMAKAALRGEFLSKDET